MRLDSGENSGGHRQRPEEEHERATEQPKNSRYCRIVAEVVPEPPASARILRIFDLLLAPHPRILYPVSLVKNFASHIRAMLRTMRRSPPRSIPLGASLIGIR